MCLVRHRSRTQINKRPKEREKERNKREGEIEGGGGRMEQKLQELHEAIVEKNLEAFEQKLNNVPKIKVSCFIFTLLYTLQHTTSI